MRESRERKKEKQQHHHTTRHPLLSLKEPLTPNLSLFILLLAENRHYHHDRHQPISIFIFIFLFLSASSSKPVTHLRAYPFPFSPIHAINPNSQNSTSNSNRGGMMVIEGGGCGCPLCGNFRFRECKRDKMVDGERERERDKERERETTSESERERKSYLILSTNGEAERGGEEQGGSTSEWGGEGDTSFRASSVAWRKTMQRGDSQGTLR